MNCICIHTENIYFIFWLLLDIKCHIYNQFLVISGHQGSSNLFNLTSTRQENSTELWFDLQCCTNILVLVKTICFDSLKCEASHNRQLLYQLKEL